MITTVLGICVILTVVWYQMVYHHISAFSVICLMVSHHVSTHVLVYFPTKNVIFCQKRFQNEFAEISKIAEGQH